MVKRRTAELTSHWNKNAENLFISKGKYENWWNCE